MNPQQLLRLKKQYRTLSFIVCFIGTFFNIALAFFDVAVGNRQLGYLALGVAAVFALGAASHWYLDRLPTPKP